MDNAEEPSAGACALDPGQMPARLHLLIPATESAVRSGLISATSALKSMGVSEDTQGFAEILLAEVLNNIVEHAYAGRSEGSIEIEIRTDATTLRFNVRDWGVPMPGLALPEGKEHDLAVPVDDLPEGGFGWFMIHTLAQNLSYARRDDQNLLTFDMDINAGF